MHYVSKGIEVQAVRYTGHGNIDPAFEGAVPDWMWEALENGKLTFTNGGDPLVIQHSCQPEVVPPGHYLVRTPTGLCQMHPVAFRALFGNETTCHWCKRPIKGVLHGDNHCSFNGWVHTEDGRTACEYDLQSMTATPSAKVVGG